MFSGYDKGFSTICRRLFILLATLSIGFFTVTSAHAATYYVATNGSDSNPGTLDKPFKTIARGSKALSSGDTLYIRAGTYNERMMHGYDGFVFKNGTASAYTRYAAYPGEERKVLIRPTKFTNYTVWFSRLNAYIEFSGFVVDGANSIYELRTDASSTSSGVGHSHHIRIINNEIKSPNDKVITVNGQTYGPASCILFGGGVGNELVKNHIHDCGSYGIYAAYSDGLIEGNVVHDTGRYAIHLFSYKTNDNWIIRNNTFYDNGIRGTIKPSSIGVALNTGSILISHGKNNQFYNNLVYGSHAGVRVWGNADNTLVANNTIYGNKGYGIRVDSTNSDNTRIINNISFGNGGGQIEDVGSGTSKQNNLTTDPKFVNAGGGDFGLQAGSPAIDKGMTLAAVPDDFTGKKRPEGSAYDIGAFEGAGSKANVLPGIGAGLPAGVGGIGSGGGVIPGIGNCFH
jgi:parallel beta-helix repeat protein